MGSGEYYMMQWSDWYEQLSEEAKIDYQLKYPEPKQWKGFYNDEFEEDEEE